MNLSNLILLLLTFLLFQNCSSGQKVSNVSSSIDQGISGKVLWREGDFMPRIGGNNENKSVGVEREILIYELTNVNQTTKSENLFTEVQSKLVKTVKSSVDGSFKVTLEPGTYSLFSKEEGGLFANIYDGQNNIFPVEVEKGKYTEVVIIVDYKAAY